MRFYQAKKGLGKKNWTLEANKELNCALDKYPSSGVGNRPKMGEKGRKWKDCKGNEGLLSMKEELKEKK